MVFKVDGFIFASQVYELIIFRMTYMPLEYYND